MKRSKISIHHFIIKRNFKRKVKQSGSNNKLIAPGNGQMFRQPDRLGNEKSDLEENKTKCYYIKMKKTLKLVKQSRGGCLKCGKYVTPWDDG